VILAEEALAIRGLGSYGEVETRQAVLKGVELAEVLGCELA
jgi:hypothetical protein